MAKVIRDLYQRSKWDNQYRAPRADWTKKEAMRHAAISDRNTAGVQAHEILSSGGERKVYRNGQAGYVMRNGKKVKVNGKDYR